MWCGAYGKALAPVLKRVKMREKRVDLRCNAFGRSQDIRRRGEDWWINVRQEESVSSRREGANMEHWR
jgi:hypothetical protein